MQIEEGYKLDFKDVLIRPKRSPLSSRSQVDLNRKYTFLNSKATYKGVPVVASNMSCVGTFAMAKVAASEGMMVALHKHYSVDQLVEWFSTGGKQDVFYTMGISEEDFKKLYQVAARVGKEAIKNICIDVANGYMNIFERKVLEVREQFPKSTIMAGNVVTGEMVEALLLNGGADIVKVGIGSGCFVKGSKIRTNKGLKNIEDVSIGDEVLTHRNRIRKVVALSKRKTNEIFKINNVQCTGNHEFYVLHKKYKAIVNDENIDEYAQWIPAEKLNKDFFLLKTTNSTIAKLES